MKITVIIPVYNASGFVARAVRSALAQKEVAEVIIVEDNSTDHSLEECRKLEAKHENVFLFQHPDRQNHGAGASRNLGVQKARFDYLAFLDADDFYCADRFGRTKEVFLANPDADGVYEAIGVFYHDRLSEETFKRLGGADGLTTVGRSDILPQDLFEFLVTTPKVGISVDGLTIKKALIDRCGEFDICLKQTQDTDFILRIARCGRLYPGRVDAPVSRRGVHRNNRIHNRAEALKYRSKMAGIWFERMLNENWSGKINRAFTRKRLSAMIADTVWERMFLGRVTVKAALLLSLLIRYPRLISKILK